MLPIYENKSYYRLLIFIYNQDFVPIHWHVLVFIIRLQKNYSCFRPNDRLFQPSLYLPAFLLLPQNSLIYSNHMWIHM